MKTRPWSDSLSDAEKIDYLKQMVRELYDLYGLDYLGLDEKARGRRLAAIDGKLREVGILEPVYEKR